MTKRQTLFREHPIVESIGSILVLLWVTSIWQNEAFNVMGASVTIGWLIKCVLFAIICWLCFVYKNMEGDLGIAWQMIWFTHLILNTFVFLFFTTNVLDGMLWVGVATMLPLTEKFKYVHETTIWYTKILQTLYWGSVFALVGVSTKILFAL